MPHASLVAYLAGHRRRAGCWLLVGGLLASLAAGAQPAGPAPRQTVGPPLPAAAEALRPLPQPAARHLRRLRAESSLRYREVLPEPQRPGLLLRLLRWLFGLVHASRRTSGGRVAWDVVVYGLVVGTLVFAVLKFLQVDLTRVFGRAARPGPLAYETGAENIHELDFDQAIAQAEAAGNRRLALRLGYLALLKQLTDQALIDWQPDKTNQAYVRELAAGQPALRPGFAELTRQFEYVWYGEWPLEAAAYQRLRQTQHAFGRQLPLAVR